MYIISKMCCSCVNIKFKRKMSIDTWLCERSWMNAIHTFKVYIHGIVFVRLSCFIGQLHPIVVYFLPITNTEDCCREHWSECRMPH